VQLHPATFHRNSLSVINKIGSHDKILRVAWWTLAVIIFGLTVAIRIRLLGIPLERDEGEYAYAGQLILQGIPPYKLAYNMKFPGTYAAYAVIMSIFGQTMTGIHLGLLLVNAATIALIFFLGRRLVNTATGLVAAASYAVLSVSLGVQGFAAHATHFVMLPALGGMLLLLDQSGRQAFGRLFASGLLFGVGLLMKQPAVFFVLFGAIYLGCRDIRRLGLNAAVRNNLIFDTGAILPFGLTCLLLWHAGVFGKFWFWTIDYAHQYGSLVPLSAGMRVFTKMAPEVVGSSGWTLWTLAGVALITYVWRIRSSPERVFLIGLFLVSVAAVCAGLFFRPHYFVLLLPAISLLVGVLIADMERLLNTRSYAARTLPLLLAAAAIGLPMVGEQNFLLGRPVDSIPRYVYGESPFVESIQIAKYIREHSSPEDTIAVLGSEPQIYFYSHRHSATGYIYTYGLMEPQKYARQMQQEMIHEIEEARPKYLVSVVIDDSWSFWGKSDRYIFNWANEYTAQNYDAVAFVNIMPAETDYFFGQIPPSVNYLRDYILLYRRKS
jgi:hypothetical protein